VPGPIQDLLLFLKRSHGRRLVLFGTGPSAAHHLSQLPLPSPVFAVDNDSARWGGAFEGIPVHPPAALSKETRGELFVVVASIAVEEISAQLEAMGFQAGIDYSVSPFLERRPGEVFDSLPPLLVSCLGHGGGLYRIDPCSGRSALVIEGDFRGLAVHPEGFLAVHEHEGLQLLDRDLNLIRKAAAPDRLNLHGAAVDPERGRIYVNETALDRVGIYHADRLTRCGELIPPPAAHAGVDLRHINDLALADGHLWLSMFSYEGVWRDRSWNDGTILRMPVDGEGVARLVHRGLRQPHSLLFSGGRLFCCNSLECTVLQDGDPLFTVNGYTRGLASVGGVFVVGQSRVRRLSRFPAHLRALSLDCGLHLWDPESRATRFVPVPAEGVFAILPLAP